MTLVVGTDSYRLSSISHRLVQSQDDLGRRSAPGDQLLKRGRPGGKRPLLEPVVRGHKRAGLQQLQRMCKLSWGVGKGAGDLDLVTHQVVRMQQKLFGVQA